MSFTVIHTRPDGTRRPIRMSIFDALRGVPDARPKKARNELCPCCGKVHTCDDAAVSAEKKKEVKGAQPSEKKDGETDDEIMIRMKAENKSIQWSDAVEHLKEIKSVGDAKARYKEITKDKQDDEGTASEGQSKGKGKEKDPEKASQNAKNKADGLKKQLDAQAKKEAGEPSDASEKGKKAKNKQNGSASTSEPNQYKIMADKYDSKKWLTVASRHYDKTGERISPEMARQRAEAK